MLGSFCYISYHFADLTFQKAISALYMLWYQLLAMGIIYGRASEKYHSVYGTSCSMLMKYTKYCTYDLLAPGGGLVAKAVWRIIT
jgi:hypothetical protein